MSIFQNRKVRFLNKFPHIFVGEAFRLPFVYAKIFGRSKPLPYDSYKFQQNEVSVTTICFFFAYFLLFTKKKVSFVPLRILPRLRRSIRSARK